MHIGDTDFYRDFLRERAGLQIESTDSFLLDTRLTPVARKWNFPSLKAMTLALHAIPDPRLVDDVIDAMMVSESEFFRDPDIFGQIERKALDFLSPRGLFTKTRIWSAGCGTGEEAWSLAMTARKVQQEQKLKLRNVELVATDISRTALARAERAMYSQHAVQTLPVAMLTEYFTPADNGWQVDLDIVNMVYFQHVNLLHDFSRLGMFDLILCRYVLNGFTDADRRKVLNALSASMTQHALLVLGADETLPEGLTALKRVEGTPFLARADGPDRI